ncbi:MAG: YraN family protein [Spirochaetales bacterium]|nr:YraN family protein [Spirochaetales bacterium]
MLQHKKGVAGEERAAAWLESHGYKILKRNFRKAFGEVDIIAVKGCKIVFFEVKNWDYIGWEDLHCSINKSKILKIRKLAELYLQLNPRYRDYELGFDLILLSRRMEEPDHIEDFT